MYMPPVFTVCAFIGDTCAEWRLSSICPSGPVCVLWYVASGLGCHLFVLPSMCMCMHDFCALWVAPAVGGDYVWDHSVCCCLRAAGDSSLGPALNVRTRCDVKLSVGLRHGGHTEPTLLVLGPACIPACSQGHFGLADGLVS